MKTYTSQSSYVPYFPLNADGRLAFFRELPSDEIVMITCQAYTKDRDGSEQRNYSSAFVRLTRVVRLHFPFLPNIGDSAGMAYCQLPDGQECRLFKPPSAEALYLAPEIWDLLEENRESRIRRLSDYQEKVVTLCTHVDNVTLANAMENIPKRREAAIKAQQEYEEEQRRKREEDARLLEEERLRRVALDTAEEEAGKRLDDLFRRTNGKSTY